MPIRPPGTASNKGSVARARPKLGFHRGGWLGFTLDQCINMAELVHPRGGWRPDRGGDPPDGTGPDPITPGGSRRRRPIDQWGAGSERQLRSRRVTVGAGQQHRVRRVRQRADLALRCGLRRYPLRGHEHLVAGRGPLRGHRWPVHCSRRHVLRERASARPAPRDRSSGLLRRLAHRRLVQRGRLRRLLQPRQRSQLEPGLHLCHRHHQPHPGPHPVLPDTGDPHPRRRCGGRAPCTPGGGAVDPERRIRIGPGALAGGEQFAIMSCTPTGR